MKQTNYIPLSQARLCLDCEVVHAEQACPLCGSRAWYYLANWLNRYQDIAYISWRQFRNPEQEGEQK